MEGKLLLAVFVQVAILQLINAEAACPRMHPYAYLYGKYCCATNREKSKLFRSDVILRYNSKSCQDDNYVACRGGGQICQNFKFGHGECPSSHPYVYLDGDYCCSTRYTNDITLPLYLKRTPLFFDSRSCKDHLFIRCPAGKCQK